MTRTRSEYRWEGTPGPPDGAHLERRLVEPSDRDAFAALLLDAYRGTVDDEGETLDDARDAADEWFGRLVPQDSFVVLDDGAIVAACFVVEVDGLPYIDPIVVAPSHQRRGLARLAVTAALASLAAGGTTTVGATITDGNVASERLFAALGFRRIGPWPPDAAGSINGR